MKAAELPTLYKAANALTAGRILAIPFAVFLLTRAQQHPGYLRLAVLILILQQASDILDGFLARRARRKSARENPFGQLMDPVADKLFIGSTYITLSLTHDFPMWITLVIILRDLILPSAWLARLLLAGIKTVRPNPLGKAAESCQALLIFVFLMKAPPGVLNRGMLLTVLITVASGAVYMAQGVQDFRKTRK